VVEITLSAFNGTEKRFAELAMHVAEGEQYDGPSQPCSRTSNSPETTVARFCQDVFDLAIEDDRVAASLSADEVWQLHQELFAEVGDGMKG
jgi:hypothetical protein